MHTRLALVDDHYTYIISPSEMKFVFEVRLKYEAHVTAWHLLKVKPAVSEPLG